MLSKETIPICNEIPARLTKDELEIVVTLGSYAAIQAALGVDAVSIGLVQGVSPEASFINFRTWLIESTEHGEYGVGSCHKAGGPFSTCWHHLSEEQATDIMYNKWHDITWVTAIRMTRPAIPGPLCTLFKVTGTDHGRSHMFVLPLLEDNDQWLRNNVTLIKIYPIYSTGSCNIVSPAL